MVEEPLLLLDPKGRRWIVAASGEVVKIPGLGVLGAERMQASIGRVLEVGGRSILVLRPTVRDLRETMERGPQTLAPKDLAALLYEADVASGARVAEAGCGSGALTVTLARAVRPNGRVFSYDLQEGALELARTNVVRAGLDAYVVLAQADVRKGVPEPDVDAVFLDMPDPWAAVPAAWEALRPCGHLATFSPNMEQVKETAAAIRRKPFVDLRTIEIIEREMEVRDVGVRPSFAALGHTGYLTFARKVLEAFPET